MAISSDLVSPPTRHSHLSGLRRRLGSTTCARSCCFPPKTPPARLAERYGLCALHIFSPLKPSQSNHKGIPTPGPARSTPALVAPPIYEVDPPYPPGLSSNGPYCDDEITPSHPPGLAQNRSPPVQQCSRQESVTVHVPVPTPHTPYQHTNDSSYELDLPTLKYSWGPPPPKPLSKRVALALFGWLDYLQQYEPRPYTFATGRSFAQKPTTLTPSEHRPASPGRSNSTPNVDRRQRRPPLWWRRT